VWWVLPGQQVDAHEPTLARLGSPALRNGPGNIMIDSGQTLTSHLYRESVGRWGHSAPPAGPFRTDHEEVF
jgi:hypothetical protein